MGRKEQKLPPGRLPAAPRRGSITRAGKSDPLKLRTLPLEDQPLARAKALAGWVAMFVRWHPSRWRNRRQLRARVSTGDPMADKGNSRESFPKHIKLSDGTEM